MNVRSSCRHAVLILIIQFYIYRIAPYSSITLQLGNVYEHVRVCAIPIHSAYLQF
jgi:hypothetical protein